MPLGPITSYRATPREMEIWELVAHGANQREIAHILSISPHTVRTHLAALMRRVGVATALELCVVWLGGALLREPCPDLDPPRVPYTPLAERARVFPTHAAADRATGLTADERAARAAAHPWKHQPLPARNIALHRTRAS